MITTQTISNHSPAEPVISGYSTISEAMKSLSETWPMIVSEREQYAVLGNYEGCLLLIEQQPEKRIETGHHPKLHVGARFNLSTRAGLQEIIAVARRNNADTFWINTGLRPCELISELAGRLDSARSRSHD